MGEAGKLGPSGSVGPEGREGRAGGVGQRGQDGELVGFCKHFFQRRSTRNPKQVNNVLKEGGLHSICRACIV